MGVNGREGESVVRAEEMQADWFVREVKRCRAIGMPLGCCDEWPECSHILAWVESRPLVSLSVPTETNT